MTEWMSVTGRAQRLNGTEGVLHKAELIDLTPATHYEYQVQVSDGEFSDRFSTSTAHASGPASFDAVFLADLALIGRSDGLETGVDRVLAAIARIEPSLILLGGDLISFPPTSASALSDFPSTNFSSRWLALRLRHR